MPLPNWGVLSATPFILLVKQHKHKEIKCKINQKQQKLPILLISYGLNNGIILIVVMNFIFCEELVTKNIYLVKLSLLK